MSAPLVHSEVEVLFGTLVVPLCENVAGIDAFDNLRDDVEMSDHEEDVTCPKCLKALGLAPERLTEAHGDPSGERFAA